MSTKKRLLSNFFFEIGNILNFLTKKPFHQSNKDLFIKDDNEALKSDWNAVGKNMKYVIKNMKGSEKMKCDKCDKQTCNPCNNQVKN